MIAEGVETEVESAETSACACDEVQGYFHAHPMPAEDLRSWLATQELSDASSVKASRNMSEKNYSPAADRHIFCHTD
jgi:predicted signal transduction protein with EAL and GGDEF domain